MYIFVEVDKMNKKYLLMVQLSITIVLVSSMFVLSSCSKQKPVVPAPNNLSDLQTTACNSADAGGTCSTKLVDLGIVTPDQCCKALGKCC